MINGIKEDSLEKFDIDEAQKLLDSIRFMSDLRRFPVQKPNSTGMEMTNMKEWVNWYAKTTEWNGTDGTENEVIKLIYNLDEDMKILTKRVEEGFRRLLSVIDRKDIKIDLLNKEIEKQNEQLRILRTNEEETQVTEEDAEDVEEDFQKQLEESKNSVIGEDGKAKFFKRNKK